MKVDNRPDQNIDQVMEDMRNAIMKYSEGDK